MECGFGRSVSDEDGIVWLKDVSDLAWVRESFIAALGATRKPPNSSIPGFLLGYAILRVGSCQGWVFRRAFWIHRYDLSTDVKVEACSDSTRSPVGQSIRDPSCRAYWGGP